jgi:DNA-binding transcriptional regulator GbsR (MarR family)
MAQHTGLWIPKEILDKPISLTAKVIWSDINSLTTESNTYFKTNATIAKGYALSVSSVSRALQELHAHDLIRTISFDGRTRVLAVTRQSSQIDTTASSNKKGSPIKSDKAAASNRPTENTSKKTLEKRVKKTIGGAEIQLPFESDNFSAMWYTWLEERRLKKLKSYTPRGEQGQLHNLQKLSNGDEAVAIQIIQQSIVQGWQGLFAIKSNARTTKNITPDGLLSFVTDG